MKTKLLAALFLIGMVMPGCKKEDEPDDVQPVQIISPADHSVVHDTVPVLFEHDGSLNIVKTDYYIDLILFESFDGVPGSIFFTSARYQKGTAHVIYLVITTKEGQSHKSNMITLIVGNLKKPVVAVNFPDKTTLQLTWPDQSNEEAGYRISRKEGTAGFSLVADLGPNSTSYTDHPIDTAKGYVYIVEAYSSSEKYPSDSIKVAYFHDRYAPFLAYDVPAAIEGKVAISPDAQKVMVTNYAEDEFTVIHTVSGIQTHLPQNGGSLGLAMSRNGDFFVTGSTHGGNKFRIWDLNTLALRNEFTAQFYVFELLVNSAGDRVLAGGEPVQVYQVSDGTLIQTYPDVNTTGRSMIFSHDESLLLTGGNDQDVKLINAETGEIIRIYVGHTGNVGTVCFNTDESKVISGSYEDKTILVWETNSGALLQTVSRNSPTVTIRNGMNGQFIVASRDGTIAVLNQECQVIQEFREMNTLLFADYNAAQDLIVAYGTQPGFKVIIFKKLGHWERI